MGSKILLLAAMLGSCSAFAVDYTVCARKLLVERVGDEISSKAEPQYLACALQNSYALKDLQIVCNETGDDYSEAYKVLIPYKDAYDEALRPALQENVDAGTRHLAFVKAGIIQDQMNSKPGGEFLVLSAYGIASAYKDCLPEE